MIKNIIFDMGNVLFRFDRDYYMDKIGVTNPDDRKLLLQEMYLSYDWPRQDRGVISLDEAEALYRSRIPVHLHDAIHYIVHDWNQDLPPVPGMAELVKELKEAGYGLYLLSNAAPDQHIYWERIPGHEFFDATLISCDVNLLKPEHEIYEHLLNTYSLKAEECVFIDDNSINVEGAHNCGIEGIVFFGECDDLKRRLKALGINLK